MVVKPSRVGALLVVVALVVSACTPSDTGADESGSASETTAGESGTASDQGTESADPDQASDGSSSGVDPIDTEAPPIPILTPSEPIVSPGDTLTVTADPRHSGPVVMRTGDTVIASANLSNGSAMIAVPGEAVAGTYTLEATDDAEGGALGVVGVADTPSLWVNTPRWISAGNSQKATITTFDIPDGLTVALELTTALEASHPTVRGSAPRGGLFAAPYLLTSGSGADDACRKALVWGKGDSEYLGVIVRKAAREIFTERLPRVDSITQDELRGMFTLAAWQQLLGTPEEDQVDLVSVAGALDVDYVITLGVTEVGGSAFLSVVAIDMQTMSVPYRNIFEAESEVALFDVSIGAEVASALQKIGICGEVDEETVKVASGEEQEITYALTDLAGEAAEGAIDAVSSTCGTFEPTSGNADGGDFTTTFTGGEGGCTDQVTFVARTDTSVGEVTTEQDKDESTTAIAIPMFAYRYTIDVESTWAAGSYSSNSASIHAESEGEFFVEPDFQQIIGAGTGNVSGDDPAAPCVLISESGTTNRPQQWAVDGTYSVWMNGDLASGSPEDGGTLRLDPAGSNINVTGSYSDPDCFPPGSQSNELFSYLIVGVLVTNPSLIVGEFPQGFEMPFTADGKRTEKSWPITVGTGSGTVTIEVWQLESDG